MMIGKSVSHYRVTAPLGAGGMAVVYLAEDTRLHRKVALKFLPPAVAQDPHSRARFMREAEAASALDHPNIATIYEIGDWEDQLFIAMAYYSGETLKQRLERGPLSISETASVLSQIATALAAAHAAGIVHRDLKPANVIVTKEGQAKILDFGLAKLVSASDDATHSQMTRAGTVVGTLAYMSPEQLTSAEVDQRSDIWSLGVMLYEMLTGRLPFNAENPSAMLYEVLDGKPAAIRSIRPDVPPEIERVVVSALHKDVAARTLSASDICAEVAAYQRRIASAELAAASDISRSVRLRRRLLLIAATVVLLAVGATTAWLWLERQGRVRWAREQAVPEIMRLAEQEQFLAAFDLALQAERHVPDDPMLARQWPIISRVIGVTTTPPGADVHYRELGAKDPAWRYLGRSPIQKARVPRMFAHWKVQKDGLATVEDVGPGPTSSVAELAFAFVLDAPENIPMGMVRVPAGGTPFSIFIPGLDHLPPVELNDFWIDAHEVTNRQFKQFVDAGGYRKPEYWRHDFIDAGRPISWQQAISRFQDQTGRPGPSGWELGSYPPGQDDYPVTGVSWYEAAAYAEYAGKALPTIFHWSRAADQRTSGIVVPASNFGGTGPLPVSQSRGMNRHGTFDMAGNVKEWTWNDAGDGKRYILGGAWNEPVYMFTDADARSPFAREATFGFRCIKLFPGDQIPSNVTAAVLFATRDFTTEKPVSDEIFGAYRSLYAYDRTDLKPVLESVDDSSPDWRREKITFAAAYGSERIIAYLFLPKRFRPPFQTLVYFPGSNALTQSFSEQSLPVRSFDFLIKSGRAVLFPVYKSTYERGDSIKSDYPSQTIAWRDHVIMWSKDLGRSIDFLETRADIDREKIGYHGLSWGGAMGALLPAVESRLKVLLLIVGGFYLQPSLPEAEALNFAPRIKIATLMLNGRYDFFYPTETSQVPMFRLLGTPLDHKRRVVYETGHNIPRNELIKETVNWLDRYLGPVKTVTSDK